MKENVKLILAPMAGVADSAFRQICKKYGADLLVSEMISAKAVCFNDKKTFQLADFDPCERPIALQIFGSEHDTMARAAKALCEGFHPDWIDVNMGCPVGKIVKSGDGSALMKDPERVYSIVAAIKDAVDVPLTVKIRSGRTEARKNAVEVALAAKRGGADMVAVHGKTAAQMYAPPVDLDIIKDVKTALGRDFPVAANGEITDAESAKRMLEYTDCDHLMIGRAALGRPWIFSEIKAYLKGESFTLGKSVASVMTEHIRLACQKKGEEIAVKELRKHIAAYIKGFKGAAMLRDKVNRALTMTELLKAAELFEDN